MFFASRTAVVPILVALAAASSVPASGGDAQVDGALHRFDLERFKRLGTIAAEEATDEFGTIFADRFFASAPGADGGGRLFFVSEDGVRSSVTAADLSGHETSRLGEDWGDLGHPPGTASAMVVGAPGEPDGPAARAGAAPAVLVVEYRSSAAGSRFSREVSRVTGPSGSLFGWRVAGTDSQFPAASFNASYIVSAPLENRGKKKRRAGAVYKFDTETGRQVWKFKSNRAGELAGYDMMIVRDTDGDGFSDVLVGAPGSQDLEVPGRLYLLSGRNGKVLRIVEAPEGAVLFGYELATGSANAALQGTFVSAPATPKGRKDAVGAVYHYADFGAEPTVFAGKKTNQWFGVSVGVGPTHLFVASFEGSRNANKDMRGTVRALLPSGKIAKTLRGKKGGEYFGRAVAVGAVLAIGAPGAPPLFVPE